jgi:hypothetical protein
MMRHSEAAVMRLACLNNRGDRNVIECLRPSMAGQRDFPRRCQCRIDLGCVGGTLVLDDVTPEQHEPHTSEAERTANVSSLDTTTARSALSTE